MRARIHPLLGLLVVLLCLFPIGLVGRGGGGEEVDPARAALRREVHRVLDEALDHDGESAEVLGQRLARMGQEALPVFLEVLDEGRDPRGEVLPSSPEVCPNAHQREALRLALTAHDRGTLRPVLEAHLEGTGDRRRATVLAVLGSYADRDDLELLLEAASPRDADQVPSGVLTRGLEEQATHVLGRDPSGLDLLGPMLDTAQPDLAGALVRAAGTTGSPRALEILGLRLGLHRTLDRVLLAQLGQLAERLPHAVEAGLVDDVRRHLADRDPQVLREALMAAARFEDWDSLERMLELLEHENRGVREASLWALRHLSGRKLGPEPGPWADWVEQQHRWAHEVAPELLTALEDAEGGALVAALNGLVQQPFDRSRHARAVALHLLGDPEPLTRRLACQALGQLASGAVVPELAVLLDDRDPEVRHACWTALCRIHGEDLPAEPSAWRAAYPTRD